MAELSQLKHEATALLLRSTEAGAAESRSMLLKAIGGAGIAGEVARVVEASHTYSVVFREAAKGPLHQLANGLFEASVKDPETGRILQNVLLQPVGLNVGGAMAAIAFQAAMYQLASRLDKLQQSVDWIETHLIAEQRGAILGALNTFDLAHHSANEAIRVQTLIHCRATLSAKFEAICLMLQKKAKEVPSPTATSIFNVTTSAKEITRGKLDELRAEVTLALVCAEGLAQIEFQLNGGKAAAARLDTLVQTFRARFPLGDVHVTARKAREAGIDEQPHLFWQRVSEMLTAAQAKASELSQPLLPEVAIQVQGSDLKALSRS